MIIYISCEEIKVQNILNSFAEYNKYNQMSIFCFFERESYNIKKYPIMRIDKYRKDCIIERRHLLHRKITCFSTFNTFLFFVYKTNFYFFLFCVLEIRRKIKLQGNYEFQQIAMNLEFIKINASPYSR